MTQNEFDGKVSNLIVIQSVASGVGLLAGAFFAYSKDKGFWGYVGFMMLGTVIGNVASGVYTIPKYLSLAKKLDTKDTESGKRSVPEPGTYGAQPGAVSPVEVNAPVGPQITPMGWDMGLKQSTVTL